MYTIPRYAGFCPPMHRNMYICAEQLDEEKGQDVMILHIAAFRWKEEVTEADVSALTDALMAMAEGIPEIRSYVAGANLHLRPAGSDYGVAAILDDQEGLDAYLDHPDHLAVYEKFIGWMLAERAAVQLPISEGSFR